MTYEPVVPAFWNSSACPIGHRAAPSRRQIFSRLRKVDWPNTGSTQRGSTAQMLRSHLQNRELGAAYQLITPGLLEETPLVRGVPVELVLTQL